MFICPLGEQNKNYCHKSYKILTEKLSWLFQTRNNFKGEFSFKKDVDELLPFESQGMDVKYKDQVINGWFTRSFENRKVNGYKQLKSIFRNDFYHRTEILVTILNPNEVKLEKIKINE